MKQTNKQFKNIHFIGVGGIGMSGLAQFFKWMGYNVSGSDRALDDDRPENKILFETLRNQGINLYPQDGSFIKNEKTELLVYSTAIEDDNPDFAAGKHLPGWHRADALSFLAESMENRLSIAITGTCGKTTVSGWLGETLLNLGLDPVVLSGGMVNRFINEENLGNFRKGNGNYFVYEADESDKSLVAFYPDYSIILNIGTDHYPEAELVEMFEQFLKNTKKGAAIEKKVYALLDPKSYEHLEIKLFSTTSKEVDWALNDYSLVEGIPKISCTNSERVMNLNLPMPGVHNAENALSMIAVIDLLNIKFNAGEVAKAIENFNGVHRRFEYIGKTKNGTKLYDDYSHNVEKIVSAISTVQQITEGRVFAVFQPHGFGPLRFMRKDLFPALEKTLRKDDKFIFMPAYYAGGTSSFKPKSSEVCEEYSTKTTTKDRYIDFDSRKDATNYLDLTTNKNDIIIIMGARDESLALWAKEITQNRSITN